MNPPLLLLVAILVSLASSEPTTAGRPLIFSRSNWPPKVRPAALGTSPPHSSGGKQRTLVVQIRSDQPVPLVLKGRHGSHGHGHGKGHSHGHLHAHPHSHTHLLHAAPPQHLRASRPLKLSSPVYLKPGVSLRKPIKIKLSNSKSQAKPVFGYEKPFKYEKPAGVSFSELQHLPLDTHNNYNTDQFAPIYTVPAPNLALQHDHDNHLDNGLETAYLPAQSPITPSTQRPPSTTYGTPDGSYYNVQADETNDQTIRDPISGSQKFFAPDPDPSLPTSKVKIATESFNTPSINQPLPADLQLSINPLSAQPLVQIVGSQTAVNSVPIYPIQFTQQETQPFIAAAVPAAHIPIYNPTYLVTQSNQLYSQHKQQLFRPSTEHVIEAGYVNADLTQEVASNGQILQAAKDPHHNIHPVLDAAPQYAALISAPSLGAPAEPLFETTPFHLPNVEAAGISPLAPEGGFVVSNFYGNSHDSSQLLQAYAEEEARRQQLETEQATIDLHKQQQQQEQQYQLEELKLQAQLKQQQELQIEDLNTQAQEQLLHQQQQQQHQQRQQQKLQLLQLQQQQQQLQQQKPQLQQSQSDPLDAASAAFEEHQRLVQQQLGSNTPLRIFVPDEETSEARLQKRSSIVRKGILKDAETNMESTSNSHNLFPISTSVEVAEVQSESLT